MRFNNPREFIGGFTSARSNAKISINSENLEQAQKIYELYDESALEKEVIRKADEEDQKFMKLLNQAKLNKIQAKFKPVKRTTAQRDQIEFSDSKVLRTEKTRKFRIPFRQSKKNTEELKLPEENGINKQEAKTSRGSKQFKLSQSQQSSKPKTLSQNSKIQETNRDNNSQQILPCDDKDHESQELPLEMGDFKHLEQVQFNKLKKLKKLKVNYEYYPIGCPCADIAQNQRACSICSSSRFLERDSLVNLVKSLDNFDVLNSRWISMKSVLISQRLQNQRKKSPHIKITKYLGSLKQFYGIEFRLNKISYIKKVLIKDISSQCRVVLQVIGILQVVNEKAEVYHQLVLYDGQYAIKSQQFSDESPNSISLEQLINQKKIKLGTKLVIWNAEVIKTERKKKSEGSYYQEEIEQVLELLENSTLQIHYNSIRKADKKLSLGQSIPENKLYATQIACSLPLCGKVPIFSGIILKAYPLVYVHFNYGKITERWSSTDIHKLNYSKDSEQEKEPIRASKFKKDDSKKTFTKPCVKVLVMSLGYLQQREEQASALSRQDLRNSALIEFSGIPQNMLEELTRKSKITIFNIEPVSFHPRKHSEGLLQFRVNHSQNTPFFIEQAPSLLKKEIDSQDFFTLDLRLGQIEQMLEETCSIPRGLNLKEFNDLVRQNSQTSLKIELVDVCDIFLILSREILRLSEGRRHINSVFALDVEFRLVQIQVHTPQFFDLDSFPKQHSRAMLSNLKYQGPHREISDVTVLRTTRDTDFTHKLTKKQLEEAKNFNQLYSKTKKLDSQQFDILTEKLTKIGEIVGFKKIKLPLTSPRAPKKNS